MTSSLFQVIPIKSKTGQLFFRFVLNSRVPCLMLMLYVFTRAPLKTFMKSLVSGSDVFIGPYGIPVAPDGKPLFPYKQTNKCKKYTTPAVFDGTTSNSIFLPQGQKNFDSSPSIGVACIICQLNGESFLFKMPTEAYCHVVDQSITAHVKSKNLIERDNLKTFYDHEWWSNTKCDVVTGKRMRFAFNGSEGKVHLLNTFKSVIKHFIAVHYSDRDDRVELSKLSIWKRYKQALEDFKKGENVDEESDEDNQ